MNKPRRVIWVTLAALFALAACEPVSGPSASAPSASPAAASSAAVLLTDPGVAAAVVADLVAAAGSAHAVRLQVTATSATLDVVIGDGIRAWAWRDGAVVVADTDVTWEGQAIFDPRTPDLTDLAGLFARAAAQSGSDKGQRLQVGEYSDGRVFMSVTTSPESSPVFFRLDATLVAPLDFATEEGLAEGLADVTAGRAKVFAVGLDAASGGLYALAPGPTGEALRTVRMPNLPVHDAAAAEATSLAPFDPARIDPAKVAQVLARLPGLLGAPVTEVGFSIDRREGEPTPYLHVTANGQSFRAQLSGAILPP